MGSSLDTAGPGHILDERSQRVLKAIVLEYFKQGEPVGSRTLSRSTDIRLSPASFRNVMADLEELGLLSHVHTSSGRVPTAQGLRFYVNSLAAFRTPSRTVQSALEGNLNVETATTLFDSANQAVSRITSFASLIAVPRHSEPRIRQVRFLKLSERRLLLVVVTSDGNVTNRVFSPEGDFAEEDLVAAANYFNRNFKDRTLAEASKLLDRQVKRLYDRARRTATFLREMLGDLAGDAKGGGELFITGKDNLLRNRELVRKMDRLQELLGTLEKRKAFRSLLENCQGADDVQIFIGNESGVPAFDDLCLVSLPLDPGDRPLGIIGVIGPRWMKYDEVIPLVRMTAGLVGNSLRQIRQEYE